MIPFAACGGKLYLNSNNEIEICLLELSANSFSFRLSKANKNIDIKKIDIAFYVWEKQAYCKLTLEEGSFALNKISEEAYWYIFDISVSDSNFSKLSTSFSLDYLNYIDYKLNLTDEEMSASLCDYPAGMEEDYSGDIDLIKMAYPYINNWREYAQKYEWALLIENDWDLKEYLETSWEEYLHIHLRLGDAFHPLNNVNIRRIYIGNSYCPCLIGNREPVTDAIKLSLERGLGVTLVLAPVAEEKYENTISEIESIYETFSNDHLEIQVNDLGSYESLSEIFKDKNAEITKGLLLYKSRRDPRNIYRNEKSINLSYGEKEIFLPYYQTNTATFCTLYAELVNRDRGKSVRVADCPGYCQNYKLAYPKHLNMVGKYNSLLAVNPDILKDLSLPEKWNLCRERMVINL